MDENKNNDLDINDTGDGFFDDVTKEEPTYKEENTDGKQGENNREKTPAPTPKKKVWKRIVAVVAAVSAVFFAFSCGVTVTQRDMDDEMRTLMNIKNTIQKEYYQNITDEEFYSVIFDAINNDLLDDYSEYMTYEEYLAMTESLAGKRSGIGVAFSVADAYGNPQMMVYRVLENSPAEQAGLRYGDLIVGFGKSETDIKESVDFNNGFQPFLNAMGDSEPFYLKIMRDGETSLVQISKEYYVESYVSYRTNKTSYGFTGDTALEMTEKGNALTCLPDDTAYIRLTQFTGNAADGFALVMEQFKKDEMTNLVLDLRENGGGYLEYLQDIAQYFCKESDHARPAAVIADYGEKREVYRAAGNRYYDYFTDESRIMVLADCYTASASECLIGCMVDYGAVAYEDICLSERNGVAKTFGKGIMQATFYVDKSKKDFLKLTTAELRWPVSEESIHARGVLPQDGTLTVAESHVGEEELQNAIALLFQ